MKGLRKYLSPFAPDQSGAAAVFAPDQKRYYVNFTD